MANLALDFMIGVNSESRGNSYIKPESIDAIIPTLQGDKEVGSVLHLRGGQSIRLQATAGEIISYLKNWPERPEPQD